MKSATTDSRPNYQFKKTIMGHIQEIEQTLREMLTHNDPEDVVRWVKERVLESYKNGLAQAGKRGGSAGGKPARSGISK